MDPPLAPLLKLERLNGGGQADALAINTGLIEHAVEHLSSRSEERAADWFC